MSTSGEETTTEELLTAREEEQVYGERLLDDLMNTFCDKLQRAAQENRLNYEGLLAIQYITLDVDSVRRLVTGKNRVIQIIFDEERIHYVVLYLNSRMTVYLYDSLNSDNIENIPVRKQIQTMFGHLYPGGEVVVKIEMGYERQHDDWSCGYRAVACVTKLARSEDPVRSSYDLPAIYRFLVSVLDPKTCGWETFKTADFCRNENQTRFSKFQRFIKNSFYLTSSLLSKCGGRKDDSPRVTVSLRPDLSYTVTGGVALLREKSSPQTDPTTTATAIAFSPQPSSEEKRVIADNGTPEHKN